ncbi:MAG: DUF2723 domain-containing protein [Saprospiraceae bacterium]|nr:DUF2723 domain-containing protein [Candidatus Vicinibacter proximus]
MNSKINKVNLTGWLVFLITFTVYFFSVERTGSLWDCGEFVLGAYKLQVVHPPGAPLFLIIGRMFTWVADVLSDDPSKIAFAVNLMSGICSAFAATFICWVTIIFGKISLYGRGKDEEASQDLGVLGAGLVAGLATAFATSVWFSAVEGEVYSMSTMFTTMTLWAAVKWYYLSNDPKNDRWLIFSLYSAGLSIGVHLLSLLAFPTIAILYYYKKWEKKSFLGFCIAGLVGVVSIVLFQALVVSGIPQLWSMFEMLCVNSFGLPFHSGLVPTVALLSFIFYYGLKKSKEKGNDLLYKLFLTGLLITISYTPVGVVLLRAMANPPINMNAPNDVVRLLPYINREQYGDRSLLKGPHFDAKPIDTKSTDRYGRVGSKYVVVDRKFDYVFSKRDQIFLPRISHNDQGRVQLHRMWMDYLVDNKTGTPTMLYNLKFLWAYQFGWMYWRYFYWNFVGKENGEQGFFPWDKKDGHWLSGISAIDSQRLYNQSQLPRVIREDQSRNTYFFLPLIFGLLGVVFHARRDRNDFLALLVLWLITGLGLCFFNNSPPNEPRERDYVLVGSIFTFCIWIGLGVLFLADLFKRQFKLSGNLSGIVASCIVISAPIIMGFQNFDDHSRNGITAARDYAINILESCQPNSIIFTYGDNDTYPVWYAQEVEGIRRDVRVINLSLIAVDWYIESQRRKVNDSPPIKMSIPSEKYRGFLRNQIFYFNPAGEGAPDVEMTSGQFLKFIGEDHPISAGSGREFETFMPTKKVAIEYDPSRAVASGMIQPGDTSVVNRIPLALNANYITKDDLAVLDIIHSNINDRPIYFSVTCQSEKLMGLEDFTSMEGLALRIVPVKTPSDRSMFIYGSGKMDVEKTYDALMNKFKWGNFDKKKLFVDHSYAPSVQGLRMMMMRLASLYEARGDKEKAASVALRYFESFPNMNFQYDLRVMPFIQSLVGAGKLDDAKKHLKILAIETADMMNFYNSLSAEELKSSFQQEKAYANSAVREILLRSGELQDQEFEKEMKELLSKYDLAPVNN